MKLKIKKNILLENLNYVSRALSNRNIIPILNGILFELTSEGLSLTSTDNDLTIKTFIEKKDILQIENEGKIVILGKYLLDIIRKLPSDDVVIEEIDGGKAIISTETSKYNLNCFEVSDFPNIKIEENDRPIKLSVEGFKDLINQTVFATSNQESRPLLTGVNIKLVGNLLESVATDSYRLAKKSIKLNITFDENINIVIPARNIMELVKILEIDEDEITMFCFNNKVLFKYKNLLFQSSLLNGTYPNTDTLIPTDYEIVLKVDCSKFYDAIDRASILSAIKDKNIIQIETKDNNLVITSSSPEVGKVEEVMLVNIIKGKNIRISFSSKYMLEALKSFKNPEEIMIMLNGEIKPIILKESENSDLTQLILPFKTY